MFKFTFTNWPCGKTQEWTSIAAIFPYFCSTYILYGNVVIVLLISYIDIPKEQIHYSWIYLICILQVDYSVYEMAMLESDNLEHIWASVKRTPLHCSENVTPVTACLEWATATKIPYKYNN